MPRARVVPQEARPLVVDAAVKASRVRSLQASLRLARAERDDACEAAKDAGASFRAIAEATHANPSELFMRLSRRRRVL